MFPTLCDPMDCSLLCTRLLCPWDSPGKNTGVDCHFLLQGIFPNQGLNPHLLCLLAWPSNRPFSAPDSEGSACLASLCTGHRTWVNTTCILSQSLLRDEGKMLVEDSKPASVEPSFTPQSIQLSLGIYFQVLREGGLGKNLPVSNASFTK